MPKHIKATLLHVVEIALAFALAGLVAYLFPEHRETVLGIVGFLLTGILKFLRANPDIAVIDYVNEQE